MNKHGKKMIAPVLVSLLIVLYYVFIAVFVLNVTEIPGILKLLLVAGPLVLTGAMIGALVSRIKEIKRGEEDDLSKY